jgi:hypothetical protein
MINKKIVLLIISCLILFSFSEDSIFINWHERRALNWKDFQGKPRVDNSDIRSAGTICGLTLTADLDGNNLTIHVDCTFNKLLSWAKKDLVSDYELNHEQGHFDIAEINARRCRHSISIFIFKDATFYHDMDSIGSYYDAQSVREQDQYDLETKHSRNRGEQELWNRRIIQELESEKSYWNPAIHTIVTEN